MRLIAIFPSLCSTSSTFFSSQVKLASVTRIQYLTRHDQFINRQVAMYSSIFLRFGLLLPVCCCLMLSIHAQDRAVTIDASNTVQQQFPLLGTNAGPHKMRAPANPVDLSDVFHDWGINAIRTHDYYGPCDWYTIFPDWNADPASPSSYYFATTDSIIQQITDGGFETLFRLGVSWRGRNPLPINDPPGTIRDANGTVIHEADSGDFAKFAEICKRIVMHYNDGWANGFRYGIKRWEIWNEPAVREQFWTGTPLQFFQMFKAVASALKTYDPALLVGGPGLAGQFNSAYLGGLIGYCKTNAIPLDFYSWHTYGGRPERINPYVLYSSALLVRETLDAAGFTSTASYCDEWNAGINWSNFSHSGRGAAYFIGALIYQTLAGVRESYIYRADNHPLGLINTDDSWKIAADALVAWKELTTSSARLSLSGNVNDSTGFTTMATKRGDTVTAVMGNFPNQATRVNLDVANLPSPSTSRWLIVRKVTTDTDRLATRDSLVVATAGSLSWTFSMEPESMSLIRLTPFQEPTGIPEPGETPLATRAQLYRNYPEPFRTTTTISFYLPHPDLVRLDILDVTGRVVKSAFYERLGAGTHARTLNLGGLSPGMYVYRLITGTGISTGKMVKM